MSPRPTVDTITSDQLDALYDDLDRYEEVQGEMNEAAIHLTRRAERAEAAIERARVLVAGIAHPTSAGIRDYDLGRYEMAVAVVVALTEPGPAGTGATDVETTARVFAALHRSAEDTVTRVIDLYERWVKAGAPPLGTPLARWWDKRLAELHNAIQPTDQTKEN